MKKLIITSIFSLSSITFMLSQIHFDVKVGVSPGSNPASAPLLVNRENPHDEFLFNMIHVKPQFYAGFRVHQPLSAPFFLESGISYTKRTSVYDINFRMRQSELQGLEMLITESEDMIQLPVDIGVALGPIDVTSGLSLTKTISSTNEFSQLKGYSTDGNSLRLGWQMGVRYGFKRSMAGIEYLGSLNRVCQGMYINEKSLEIMNVPGRFVFTLQYRF